MKHTAWLWPDHNITGEELNMRYKAHELEHGWGVWPDTHQGIEDLAFRRNLVALFAQRESAEALAAMLNNYAAAADLLSRVYNNGVLTYLPSDSLRNKIKNALNSIPKP